MTSTIRKAALVFGGAALLLATAAGPAQAAGGEFDYTTQDGQDGALTEPPDGVCLQLPDVIHASNGTDSTAFVYVDDSCTQPAFETTAGPGGIWDWTNPPPAPALSVMFGSNG